MSQGLPSHEPRAVAESKALHERVRAFARAALPASGLEPASGEPATTDGFESLALDIARFQAEHNPAFARLCRHARARLETLAAVPAVPADAFRLGRVATHPAANDVAAFVTSGTTGGAGRHAFRTLDTYAELCVRWGRRALLRGRGGRCTVLALAPPFEPERRSSLGYMMQRFIQELDGRRLGASSPGEESPGVSEPGRWLLSAGRIDVEALRRGVARAEQRAEPVLLLSTAFALVWLLDELAGAPLPLPPGSVVMQTGGFKGRSRSVDARELAARICAAFNIASANLISEYGMTELSSQLYDRGFDASAQTPSVFIEPPWVRVTPVDPASLEPVAPGGVGLARFTDLANVDSAVVVLTRDLVRRESGGVVLIGRQPGARLRGCSLAVEALAPWASGAEGAASGSGP